MPRPPYFGDDTPKVLDLLRRQSEYHQQNRRNLSLTQLVQEVRAKLPQYFHRPPSGSTKLGVLEFNTKEVNRVRHIVFNLCRKHEIWFGKQT